MSRRSLTDEERTMQYLETATLAQLDAILQSATLIKRIKYREQALPPVKRVGRPAGTKNKPASIVRPLEANGSVI